MYFPEYLALLISCSVGFSTVLNFLMMFFCLWFRLMQGGAVEDCIVYCKFGSGTKKEGMFLSLLMSFSLCRFFCIMRLPPIPAIFCWLWIYIAFASWGCSRKIEFAESRKLYFMQQRWFLGACLFRNVEPWIVLLRLSRVSFYFVLKKIFLLSPTGGGWEGIFLAREGCATR